MKTVDLGSITILPALGILFLLLVGMYAGYCLAMYGSWKSRGNYSPTWEALRWPLALVLGAGGVWLGVWLL